MILAVERLLAGDSTVRIVALTSPRTWATWFGARAFADAVLVRGFTRVFTILVSAASASASATCLLLPLVCCGVASLWPAYADDRSAWRRVADSESEAPARPSSSGAYASAPLYAPYPGSAPASYAAQAAHQAAAGAAHGVPAAAAAFGHPTGALQFQPLVQPQQMPLASLMPGSLHMSLAQQLQVPQVRCVVFRSRVPFPAGPPRDLRTGRAWPWVS